MKFSVFEEAYRWAEHNGSLIQAFDEIDSTNNLAKDKAWWIVEPLIVLTKTQTKGRGRGTNTWIDCGDGNSLLITWSFGLPTAPSHLTAARVGLALYQSAATVWDELSFSLKAPNDLLLLQRKVAGLLVEVVQQGDQVRWIVGLGMNFFETPREFPDATSINEHGQMLVDDFKLFLELFNSKLNNLIPQISEPKLNPDEQEQLFNALRLTEAYSHLKSITADGDLIFTDKKISWSHL